jgi:hypothetical protein
MNLTTGVRDFEVFCVSIGGNIAPIRIPRSYGVEEMAQLDETAY